MEERNSITAFEPQAVVVDAGEFPSHPVPLGLLDSGLDVVCCDGASAEYIASGRRPWRIVGDLDSVSSHILGQYASIIVRSSDQETNDQTKAVTLLRDMGISRVAIVGATGKREDHTLGNISLLPGYHRLGMDVRMYTDYGVFVPCNGLGRFAMPVGTRVSVFGFGATDFTSQGLKYPLHRFTELWQGTLNQSTSPVFTIRAEGEYLVFLNY